MSAPERPLRPPFGPSRRRRPSDAGDRSTGDRSTGDRVAGDRLTGELRAEYAAPEEPRYWDAFEARILAAVRDGAARATATTTGAFRAVPAVAVEWWHALARWAEPGLAAAGVALVIATAVFVEARATVAASRAHSAFRDVLDAPLVESAGTARTDTSPAGGSVFDAGLARAGDDAASDDTAEQAQARRARLVDELLSGGVARRHPSAIERAAERVTEPERGPTTEAASDPTADRQRRDATFRELLPRR
ncbi:hypothetical protein tb265_30560 [Gemmatimonadetes bacterium T265]|nr:hypothetical protein tb265_30560 [Gemmatimonadetes bacterium T265]